MWNKNNIYKIITIFTLQVFFITQMGFALILDFNFNQSQDFQIKDSGFQVSSQQNNNLEFQPVFQSASNVLLNSATNPSFELPGSNQVDVVWANNIANIDEDMDGFDLPIVITRDGIMVEFTMITMTQDRSFAERTVRVNPENIVFSDNGDISFGNVEIGYINDEDIFQKEGVFEGLIYHIETSLYSGTFKGDNFEYKIDGTGGEGHIEVIRDPQIFNSQRFLKKNGIWDGDVDGRFSNEYRATMFNLEYNVLAGNIDYSQLEGIHNESFILTYKKKNLYGYENLGSQETESVEISPVVFSMLRNFSKLYGGHEDTKSEFKRVIYDDEGEIIEEEGLGNIFFSISDRLSENKEFFNWFISLVRNNLIDEDGNVTLDLEGDRYVLPFYLIHPDIVKAHGVSSSTETVFLQISRRITNSSANTDLVNFNSGVIEYRIDNPVERYFSSAQLRAVKGDLQDLLDMIPEQELGILAEMRGYKEREYFKITEPVELGDTTTTIDRGIDDVTIDELYRVYSDSSLEIDDSNLEFLLKYNLIDEDGNISFKIIDMAGKTVEVKIPYYFSVLLSQWEEKDIDFPNALDFLRQEFGESLELCVFRVIFDSFRMPSQRILHMNVVVNDDIVEITLHEGDWGEEYFFDGDFNIDTFNDGINYLAEEKKYKDRIKIQWHNYRQWEHLDIIDFNLIAESLIEEFYTDIKDKLQNVDNKLSSLNEIRSEEIKDDKLNEVAEFLADIKETYEDFMVYYRSLNTVENYLIQLTHVSGISAPIIHPRLGLDLIGDKGNYYQLARPVYDIAKKFQEGNWQEGINKMVEELIIDEDNLITWQDRYIIPSLEEGYSDYLDSSRWRVGIAGGISFIGMCLLFSKTGALAGRFISSFMKFGKIKSAVATVQTGQALGYKSLSALSRFSKSSINFIGMTWQDKIVESNIKALPLALNFILSAFGKPGVWLAKSFLGNAMRFGLNASLMGFATQGEMLTDDPIYSFIRNPIGFLVPALDIRFGNWSIGDAMEWMAIMIGSATQQITLANMANMDKANNFRDIDWSRAEDQSRKDVIDAITTGEGRGIGARLDYNPFSTLFSPRKATVWDRIKKTLNDITSVIREYPPLNSDKITSEVIVEKMAKLKNANRDKGIPDDLFNDVRDAILQTKRQIEGIEGGKSPLTEAYLAAQNDLGYNPQIYQLASAYLASRGYHRVGGRPVILDIATGQGKTITTYLTNFLLLNDRGFNTVVNLTSNPKLAEKDVREIFPAFHRDNIRLVTTKREKLLEVIGFDGEGNPIYGDEIDTFHDPSGRNRKTIIYAEYTKPAFHALRQMALANYQTWDSIKEDIALVMDEVDAIAIDQARSALILSMGGGEKYDSNSAETAFFEAIARGGKPAIPNSIIQKETQLSIDRLRYVKNNASAILSRYKEGKNYIVSKVDGKEQVIVINEFNDHPELGKQWMNWIHQLVEAKVRLSGRDIQISRRTNIQEMITMHDFINQFGFITGYSGTAEIFRDIFAASHNEGGYDAVTLVMPKDFQETRFDHIFGYQNETAKTEVILDTITETINQGKSVLFATQPGKVEARINEIVASNPGIRKITTRDIEENGVPGKDDLRGSPFVIEYSAKSSLNEDLKSQIEAIASLPGAIVVASTGLLGRGVNIKPDNGLVVISDGLFSQWKTIQLIGRPYRGGTSGASFTFFSWNDLTGYLNAEALKGRITNDEGVIFARNDPHVLAVQREHLHTIFEGLRDTFTRYRIVGDFLRGAGEDFYIRPLINSLLDPEGSKSKAIEFWENIQSLGEVGLRNFIENSEFLSEASKKEILDLVDNFSERLFSENPTRQIEAISEKQEGQIRSSFQSPIQRLLAKIRGIDLDRQVEELLQNSNYFPQLLDMELILEYKSIVCDIFDMRLQGSDTFDMEVNNIIQEAYMIYQIRAILLILNSN